MKLKHWKQLLSSILANYDITSLVKEEIAKQVKNRLDTRIELEKWNKLLQDQFDEYIKKEANIENIKRSVFKIVHYFIKNAVENNRTFAEIKNLDDKSLEDIFKWYE